MSFQCYAWYAARKILYQLYLFNIIQLEKAAEGKKDVEAGILRPGNLRKFFGFLSPIFVQSFTLTFVAEWGDRSQITTIVLAASEVGLIQ